MDYITKIKRILRSISQELTQKKHVDARIYLLRKAHSHIYLEFYTKGSRESCVLVVNTGAEVGTYFLERAEVDAFSESLVEFLSSASAIESQKFDL